MKKRKQILFSIGLFVATPVAFFPQIQINIETQSNIKATTSAYDPNDVYKSFSYVGKQTIESEKKDYNKENTPPEYTIIENISINHDNWGYDNNNLPPSGADEISLDDFDIQFTLTGNVIDNLYDLEGTMGAGIAAGITTTVSWGRYINTEQIWTHEDGTILPIIAENEKLWKEMFAPGSPFAQTGWDQILKKLPEPYENPLYNTQYTINELKNTNPGVTVWKEPFVDTTNKGENLSLNTTYHFDISDGKRSANYLSRSYWDWLNHTFKGYGSIFVNSNALFGYGFSILDYKIELVDYEGTVYEIRKVSNSNQKPNFNEIVDVSSIYVTNDRTEINFDFSNSNQTNIDLELYDLEYQILDNQQQILVDWTGIPLDSTEWGPRKDYPKDINGNFIMLNPDIEYEVRVQDVSEPSIPYESKLVTSEFKNIGTSSFNLPWWLWIVISISGIIVLAGIYQLLRWIYFLILKIIIKKNV